MRLIDADAFDERVRTAGGMSEDELTDDFKDGVQAVLYMLSKQPTIEERKRGKWLLSEMYQSTHVAMQCNNCNAYYDMTVAGGAFNFCLHCGADMRGEPND